MYRQSEILNLVGLCALLVAVTALGCWIGRRPHRGMITFSQSPLVETQQGVLERDE